MTGPETDSIVKVKYDKSERCDRCQGVSVWGAAFVHGLMYLCNHHFIIANRDAKVENDSFNVTQLRHYNETTGRWE